MFSSFAVYERWRSTAANTVPKRFLGRETPSALTNRQSIGHQDFEDRKSDESWLGWRCVEAKNHFCLLRFKRRKNAILSWWMISDMLPCSKQQWTLWFINSLLKNWQFSLLISFRMPSPRRVRFLKFIHIGTSGKRRACCIFVKLI